MSKELFSVEKYLERIGYNRTPTVNFETLSELQYRHFLSIPYENIDILNNIPLSLEIYDLYTKIILKRRGGYCFELNALFNHLLKELGFKTTTYISRFLMGENEIPMRRHRVMKVEIQNEETNQSESYLTDVGVGSEVPIRPLKLIDGYMEEISGTLYRLNKEPFFGWVLSYYNDRKDDTYWERIYSFTEEEQLEVDFIQPNFYCQYHPESIFKTRRMVAIRTESGKISIDDNRLKIIDSRSVSDRTFDDSALNQILEEYFGVSL